MGGITLDFYNFNGIFCALCACQNGIKKRRRKTRRLSFLLHGLRRVFLLSFLSLIFAPQSANAPNRTSYRHGHFCGNWAAFSASFWRCPTFCRLHCGFAKVSDCSARCAPCPGVVGVVGVGYNANLSFTK